MSKSSILLVKCENCGITFRIDKSECAKNYRKTHEFNGMKKRILELNRQGKK